MKCGGDSQKGKYVEVKESREGRERYVLCIADD
jgi:hypothetical protein